MPAEWRKMSDSRSKTKNLVDNNGQWFLSWQIFLVTTSRLSNVFLFLFYPVRGKYAMTSGYISLILIYILIPHHVELAEGA